MNPDRPLLVVRELTVPSPAGPLLEGVDLRVRPGELHVLSGPNGSGKSTLLRAVLGELEFRGTIELRVDAAARLAYVPQVFELDRSLPLTAREFLALGLQTRPVWLGLGGDASAEVDGALEEVRLAERGDRPLGALSGGELQRVLLARALLQQPRLILLDEAARGLDREGRACLERLLARWREEEAGVLLVSHEPEQIASADAVTELEAA